VSISTAPDGDIGGETPVDAVFSEHLSHMSDDLWAYAVSRGPTAPELTTTATQHVSELRARLEKGPILDSPERVSVRGVFYPAILLTPGIWERPDPGEGAPAIEWRTPLQDWLFSGFEEWAPSWDINMSATDADDRPLFGQLGYEDEAFSLLVVVTGPSAGKLRTELLAEGEMVCNVELSCSVVHRRQARAAVPQRMQTWGKTFDYCLLVDLEQGHRIERVGATDPYSGYLWECVSPQEWLGQKEVPDLVDTFFVWEHTNFASSDARDYGLEALRQKRAYIEQRFGELELIQKCAPIAPGEPRLATESFHALVARGAA
jgi:hypothetical protein